jgi:hypothetical protein
MSSTKQNSFGQRKHLQAGGMLGWPCSNIRRYDGGERTELVLAGSGGVRRLINSQRKL